MIQEVHEETITETMTEEKETINDEKETPEHNTTLAILKMDNIYPLEEIWINSKISISQKLAIQESADKKEKTLNEMLPAEVLDYKDIFDKQMAEHITTLGSRHQSQGGLCTQRLQNLPAFTPRTTQIGQIH